MQIEVRSPHTITRPTPVHINATNIALPDGDLSLRCEQSGQSVPAQKAGGAIVAVLSNLPEGETKRFHVEESAPAADVTLHETASTLELRLPQGTFGIYHFGGDDVVRPFVWPLNGPGQTPMTRAFPMQSVEGETNDHPHHTSLWSAFDEVNGVNNWHNAEGHGFTRHQSFLNQQSGAVVGGFAARATWESAEGKPILDETRVLRLYNAGEELRLFDYEITFAANEGEVTFNDTKEAGVLAVRVATSMDGARGGAIVNSEGGRGESECWGRKAAWCDYSGEVNGQTVGITIFDHPRNPNFPTRWHVRDYGLFATNPFSTACFNQGAATPFVLPAGKSVTFRYRVLLHRGDAQAAHLAEFYQSWSEPPTGGVLM